MEEMHDQGSGFFSWCKPEWSVIKAAPRSFGISLLALTSLVGFVIYWAFSVNLQLKSDLISSLKETNSSLNEANNKLLQEVQNEKNKRLEPQNTKEIQPWSKTMEVVRNKTFENQEVEIDGKLFYRSLFRNVTFLYHGVGPVNFDEESNFSGSISIETDNRGIIEFMKLNAIFAGNFPVPVIGGLKDLDGNRKALVRTYGYKPQQKDKQPKKAK